MKHISTKITAALVTMALILTSVPVYAANEEIIETVTAEEDTSEGILPEDPEEEISKVVSTENTEDNAKETTEEISEAEETLKAGDAEPTESTDTADEYKEVSEETTATEAVETEETGSESDQTVTEESSEESASENTIQKRPFVAGLGRDENAVSPIDSSYKKINARSAILMSEDGRELDSLAIPRRYVTSDENYAGNGATPKIADYAKSEDDGGQGGRGLCWVYSTLKAIEINLALHGVETNLSEKNLVYHFWNRIASEYDKSEDHGLDDAYNWVESGRWDDEGGTDYYLDTYFAAWKGFVEDKGIDSFNKKTFIGDGITMDDPGVADALGGLPDSSKVYNSDIGHIKNIYQVAAKDQNAVKSLVMKYGAVTCGVDSRNGTYGDTAAWYNPEDGANHQVIIIGWDDDYSKENFHGSFGKPSRNGAWYCMNSWGKGFAYEGQDVNGGFWMSYECNDLSNGGWVQAYETTVPSDENWYDHNYVSATGGLIYDKSSSTFMSVRAGSKHGITYTVNNENNDNEIIKAIGLDTGNPDTDWTLKTFKGDFDHKELVDEQEVNIPLEGYHTVELETPFEVKNGDSFYIEVTPLTRAKMFEITPGYKTGCAGGHFFQAYTHAGSAFGQSYINDKLSQKQCVIHVFTNDVFDSSVDHSEASEILASDIAATYGDAPIKLSGCYTFKAGKDQTGCADIIDSVTSDSDAVRVSMNSDTLTFAKAGKAKITVTTQLGYEGSFEVTVNKKDISGSELSEIEDAYSVTESELPYKPTFALFIVGKRLGKDDYTVKYENNDSEGVATVTVKGKGNYTGEITKTFRINIRKAVKSQFAVSPLTGEVGEELNLDDYYTFTPGSGEYGGETAIESIISSDNDIAVVYKMNGYKVKLAKVGTTVITLTASDDVTAEIPVTVNKKVYPVNASVLAVKSDISGTVGGSVYLDNYYTFKAGNDENNTAYTLSVRSGDDDIAEISGKTVNLKKVGKTSIILKTSDGIEKTIQVTVKAQVKLSRLIKKSDITGEIGDEVNLKDYYTFAAGNDDEGNVTSLAGYEKDDAYVTLTGDTIRLNKQGTTSVKVKTSDGQTLNIGITIRKKTYKPNSSSLTAKVTTADVISGKSVDFTRYFDFTAGNDEDNNPHVVAYTSNNTKVAEVNGTTVTFKGTGEATITATTSDGKIAKVKFTVYAGESTLTVKETKITGIIGDHVSLANYYSFTAGLTESGTKTTLSYRAGNDNISIKNGSLYFDKVGSSEVIFETSDGKTGRISVTVEKKTVPVKKSRIQVFNSTYIGEEGDSVRFDDLFRFTPGNDEDGKPCTAEIRSNSTSVTVGKDAIVLNKAGKAEVTITSTDDVQGKITVTVNKKSQAVKSQITVKRDRIQGKVGKDIDITDFFIVKQGKDADGNLLSYTVESLNKGFIDKDTAKSGGSFVCKKPGTATLMIKTADNVTAYIEVVIKQDKIKSKITVKTIKSDAHKGGRMNISDIFGFEAGEDEDGNKTSVSFRSETPEIAALSGSVFTFKKAGKARVTAVSTDGESETVTLDVVDLSRPSELTINKDNIKGYVGRSDDASSWFTFTAGSDENGRAATLTLTSHNANVITVNGTTVNYNHRGSTTLTVATSDGISGTIRVTVKEVPVQSQLTILKGSVEGTQGTYLDPGAYYSFVQGSDEDGNKTRVRVSSDNENIVKMINGRAYLVTPGSARITVKTSDDVTGTINVTVKNKNSNGGNTPAPSTPAPGNGNENGGKKDESKTPVPVQNKIYKVTENSRIDIDIKTPDSILSVSTNSVNIPVKGTIVSATKTAGKAKYKSSNKKVANVNSKGQVRGKKPGSTTITKYVRVTTTVNYLNSKGKLKKKKKNAWVEAGMAEVLVRTVGEASQGSYVSSAS